MVALLLLALLHFASYLVYFLTYLSIIEVFPTVLKVFYSHYSNAAKKKTRD